MPTERSADRPHMPGYGVSTKRKGILLWSWAEERLSNCRNYYAATVRKDGRPHVMPVWGVWFGGCFYFHTSGTSRKARNLAANAECVVTTEGAAEPVILEGRAKKVTGKAVLQRFASAYRKKYDWEPDPAVGDAWVVQPTKAFAFIEAADQFGASATRWTFDSRSSSRP